MPLFLFAKNIIMKKTTKEWLIQAGRRKEVFERILRRLKVIVISLLSLLGMLTLLLFACSPFFRNSLSEIIVSNILYFEYGSHENLIEKVWNMDLKNLQTVEYDKEVVIPQWKLDQLDPTFLSSLDGQHDLEIMVLSWKASLGYISYNPDYKWLLNSFPYTEHAFKVFWQEEGKMASCILIKKGKSGFSNWITPEQNPHQCEIIWIDSVAYQGKQIFSLSSFSKWGTIVKFSKYKAYDYE